jgi:hypothetical protein
VRADRSLSHEGRPRKLFALYLHVVYKISSMAPDEYRSALQAAIKEYEALGQQRRDIDSRLAQLAQTIGTLSRLLGLTPTVPMSITEAVRLAMRSGVPMTPMEVRDRLLAIGTDLSAYSNDLAVIHTVLKRLNAAGELRIIPRASGKNAYLWATPPRVIALGPEVAEFIRGAGKAPSKRSK